jgi:hypothetical protein
MLSAGYAAEASSESGIAPELLARARAQGEVRVIVHLRVEAPGSAAIAAAQDAVLAELSPTSYRLGRRFTAIPFMSLSASEAALRTLGESTDVLDVQEDRPSAPLPSAEPPR